MIPNHGPNFKFEHSSVALISVNKKSIHVSEDNIYKYVCISFLVSVIDSWF